MIVTTNPQIGHVLGRLSDVVQRTPMGWSARCPAHEDEHPSLSIAPGSEGRVLLLCRAGCATEDVVAAAGLEMTDLFEPKADEPSRRRDTSPRREVAAYSYHDADGALVYQNVRFDPKDFRMRRPDGQGGWIWNLDGTVKVLYRLPELVAADPDEVVFIPEGEKDVDRLMKLGLVATTNPNGAGKWVNRYREPLQDRDVVLLPDNDDVGRKHVAEVERHLWGVARSVRILELPNLPDKGDVSDWLNGGGTTAALLDLIHSAATAHIGAAERIGSAAIDSAATPVVAAASIPLRFRTAREMAAELPTAIEWRIQPWAVTGGITEVVGKIKSAGKTTLVMAMCRAVLDGLPFLGEPTTKTAVVYLTEQPPSSLREALRRADLLERDDFSLLTWRDTAGHKWPDIVRAAVAECGRRGAGLLVVDTLGRFAGLRGDAENNAAEADAVMAELQIAAADGLSVIVIRHERKSGGDVGESGRGSSAYGGAVDIVLAVRRGEGNTRNTIRVIHALSRFDETPETLAIELTDEGYVARGNEAAVAIEEAVDALREALPKAGTEGLTSAEVEMLLKTRFGRTTTQEAMKRLLEAGDLERTGAGKKGNPYRHAIRSAALGDESRRNELEELYADMADREEPPS